MKKSLIILLTVFSLLLLTGCSKDDDTADLDISAAVQESFTGIIESIPSEISGVDATHLLETNDGKTIYLKSALFDLGKFEGSELRVYGVLSTEDVSGIDVSVLTVDGRDIISFNEVEEETTNYSFEKKGFSISLATDKYKTTELDSLVSFKSDDIDFTIKPNLKGVELDLALFIEDNFGDQIPQTVENSSGDRFSKMTLGSDHQVYLRDTSSVIYEIDFRSSLESQAETAQLIDDILDNIDFDPLSIQVEQDIELNPETEEDESQVEEESDEESSNEEQAKSESVNLEGLSELSSNNIKSFLDSKSDLTGGSADIISYGFTEDGYAYISFEKNNEKVRHLYKIDEGSFNLVAEFEEGVETDWELVSGDNLAFNKALTMVFVEEEGYREVFLNEGYRYFESRPLKFGLHYPKNWYYSREGDAYLFSDKPIGESETLVTVEVTDKDFDSISGEKVSSIIKKSSSGAEIVFSINKEDTGVIILKGKVEKAEELEVMAKTLLEIK